MIGLPSIDVTVELRTEGGTQILNATVAQAPDFPEDFTEIALITIPGGVCAASSGPYSGPVVDDDADSLRLAASSNWA